MIDFHTPRFKSSQVAAAAGIEINRFRTFFKRGQFRILDETARPAEMHGVAHLYSLRDAMGFAIAAELIRAGAESTAAFNAGMWGFAHVGSGASHPPVSGEPPMREPGELWDAQTVGYTMLAFFPATGGVRVFPMSRDMSLSALDAIYDPNTRSRSTAILLFLNDLERHVFNVLGVNGEGAHG